VEVNSPEGKENQVIQVNKMKVQVPDFTENLTQLERDLFHILMSLTLEKNHAQRDLFYFYTSLKLKINYACRFHFYTSLKLEVNYACRDLIHFLTRLT